MTLGISVDGVLRDYLSQFDKMYRKTFIKNDSLVAMDENFKFIDKIETEEEKKKIESLKITKINLPMTSLDIMNHYHYNSQNELNYFLYSDFVLEIFGMSGQFPKSFDALNLLHTMGKNLNNFDIVLFGKGTEKYISSTYVFLGKNGCKIPSVKFLEADIDKWKYCDVLIDDSPYSLGEKPENKISIKINRDYNTYTNSDYSFNSLKEFADNEELILKLFKNPLL